MKFSVNVIFPQYFASLELPVSHSIYHEAGSHTLYINHHGLGQGYAIRNPTDMPSLGDLLSRNSSTQGLPVKMFSSIS